MQKSQNHEEKERKMERKNTILLTVIAVATLLVAVVGATFAYFTASTGTSGNAAGNTTAETAKMAQVSFKKETISNTANTIYPGTYNAVGAGFTTQVTGDGATGKTYTINYTVSGKVELLGSSDSAEEFAFPVKWRLYESNQKITNNQIVTCDEVTNEASGTEVHYSQSCDEHASIGTLVKSGVLNPTSGEKIESGGPDVQISSGSSVDITYSKEIDSTSAISSKYYYLVVEYVSYDGNNQNADIGKKIKVSLSDINVTESKEKATD